MIDPAQFTSPLDPANPSGPNLEYDPDFLALERAQRGRPEGVLGDKVEPAVDPDWFDVRSRAEALLDRARDLRVGMALSMALLKTEGLAGFAGGLTVLNRLLEGQWDTVHPQLDPEDDDDPTSRVNSLAGLTAPEGFLKALREAPLVHSRAFGRLSLRDIRIASGKQPAPASMKDPPDRVRLDAAFRDADLTLLKSTAAAAAAALDQAGGMDRLLVEKLGERAPELKPLILELSEIKGVLGEKLGAQDPGATTPEPAPGASAGGSAGAESGAVSSREDVVRQLDRLCEYYRRYEPSSPIPLLLERAKRLVAKDFMTIIRDMTPAGVAEAELLSGVEKKDR